VILQERRAAGAVGQRLDVVDLPVDRVRRRVSAPAAAAAVEAVDREMGREQPAQLPGTDEWTVSAPSTRIRAGPWPCLS
jgi:hypothetical protein